jgi:transposase
MDWTGTKVRQSGNRERITEKIHKGGNKYLRRALTTIVQFVKSLYDKNGKYWKTICAGARKLACIIRTLLSR